MGNLIIFKQKPKMYSFTEIDPQKRRAMWAVIFAQCAGAPASIFFINGFMLTYLSGLGYSNASILLLLTLPNLLPVFIMIPAALVSDRFGMKKVGTIGLIGTIIGFLLVTIAGSFTNDLMKQTVIAGIIIFGTGIAVFASNFYALLHPIIPDNIRGRFFGKMHLSWQSVSIVLTLIASALLKINSSIPMFQLVLTTATLLLAIRMIFYFRIPEIENHEKPKQGIVSSLRHIIGIPNFMPFCSYIFLITLCTGSLPWIFSLLEKDVLGFEEGIIVLMGTLLLIGSLVGFYLGGKMVDRYGTKYVFLICHFTYGLVLFLVLARDWFPMPLIIVIGICTAMFGLIQAASGIAFTSELFVLIPVKNRSLSTAFATTLQMGGLALSGLIFSQVIDLKILSDTWVLLGKSMSMYDTIFLGCGIGIILLIVTLGLVPSIVKNAQWIPRVGMTNASS